MKFTPLILTALLLAPPAMLPVVAAAPVKVFILAGQSNMEGQGFIAAEEKRHEGKGSLEFLAKNPATAARFKQLVDKNGQWIKRDDDWNTNAETCYLIGEAMGRAMANLMGLK